MGRFISPLLSVLPLAVIGGLLYGALFIKPQAVGASVSPPAIERRDSFFGLALPAPGVVWAVGNYGKILKSEDSGKQWAVQTAPLQVHLQDIAAWDAKQAVAVGNQGVVLITRDGGASWVEIHVPTSQVANKLLRVRSFPQGEAWAVGVMGAVLQTQDFGASWARVLPERDQAWNDIAFVGKYGWLVGEFGRMMRTDDAGATWGEVQSGLKRTLTGVAFRDEKNGVAVGLEGAVLVTSDGGDTWREEPSLTSEHLFSVTWDGARWSAVGDKGMLVESAAQPLDWRARRMSERDLAWHTSVIGDGPRRWVAGANLGVIENGKFSAFGSR